MTKNSRLSAVWTNFIENWQDLAEQSQYPRIEPDADWPSPCEFIIDNVTYWQPVLQSDHVAHANRFDNVGVAMELDINEQYAEFFSLYFSEGISAKHEKGELTLLQAWSQDDFERLQQNLIGHLMMKKKLKQQPTLFFAVTDQDDLNIVVNNITGQVCLEYVGKEPHEVLADDLASFLESCQPSFATN